MKSDTTKRDTKKRGVTKKRGITKRDTTERIYVIFRLDELIAVLFL